MVTEAYTVNKAIREIECDISFLEDAPDEMLLPFLEKFGLIGERLLRLRECLGKENIT